MVAVPVVAAAAVDLLFDTNRSLSDYSCADLYDGFVAVRCLCCFHCFVHSRAAVSVVAAAAVAVFVVVFH